MANYPVFPITPRMAAVNFSTGDSTNDVNIITGGDNGTRIYSALFYDKTATARLVNLKITNGTTTVQFGQTNVNSSAGVTESILPGDLPVDAHNNSYVILPSNSWALAVSLNAAVSATNDVSITVFGEDL